MVKKRSFCFFKILKHRKGVTMTEIAVVLSLIAIMTAIAVPSYISWLPRHKLQTSVRQIYDDMNLAENSGYKRQHCCRYHFHTVAETYTVFFDNRWNFGLCLDGGETIIKAATLRWKMA